MHKLLISGFLIWIGFILRSHSQIPSLEFAHITTANGLSHGTVNVIFKDSQGYMWFGTGDGLNRYDGHTFKVFKENTLQVGTYKGNYPRGIVEDTQGNLWIGTNKGLHKYDPETETIDFIHIDQLPNGETFIQDIELDAHGTLWMASYTGLITYQIDSARFTVYDASNIDQFNFKNLFSVELISPQTCYVSSDTDLYLIDLQKKTAKSVISPLGSTITDQAYNPSTQELWIATRESGLYKYESTTQNLTTFHVSPSSEGIGTLLLRKLFLDNQGNLWIGTDGAGLNVYAAKEGVFKKYTLENGNERSLSSNAILSILVEENNVVWLGTYSAGVNHFSPYRYKFDHIKNNPELENSISHNHVISIDLAKRNGLWIGTDGGGLDYLNLSNRKISSHFGQPNKPYSDQKIVLKVLQDNNDNLWLTTYPGQVYRHNLNTQNRIKLAVDESETLISKGLPSTFVWTMIEDSDKNIWFATSLPASITKYDPQTNKFYQYGLVKEESSLMACDYVFDLEEGPNGHIWAGTDKHIYRLDADNQSITAYKASEKENSLADQFINDLYFDQQGTLWAGTYNGLSKQLKDSTFKNYHTTDGLPNDLISAIMEDESGKLWISTNQGLSLFDPVEEKFQNYGVKDGLGGISFKARSVTKTEDGSIFFGGTHGISIVNPSQLMLDERPPLVKLSKLSIFNQEVLPNQEGSPLHKSISRQKEVTLDHTQSVFTIEYTALDYIAPENNQFAYRLIGLEEEWNYVGKRRIATYTSLSPGEYTFQVKASNHDGIWVNTPVELDIIVLPPWYSTWWARIIYVFIFTMGIYFTVQLRLGFLEKQKLKLEKLVKEKTEELAHSNHELSTANDALIDANTRLMEKTEELEDTLNNLKDTQTKLVQSEKMASLGTLTAGVGHEINNPLNFIKGGVEGISNLLQDQEPLDEDKANKFIHIVKEGVKRASMIVKSLSHFSHRSDGITESCDIHSVLENCLVILGGKFNGKVYVHKNYHEKPIMVKCNEGRLHQAFLNLLANAEQAIDKEGEIEITTTVNNKDFFVSIRDTGSGIAKKNLEKIMDPFFTTKAPGKGTGLGLSITYNIIKEHQGHIEVESEIGSGTTFTVQLPIG